MTQRNRDQTTKTPENLYPPPKMVTTTEWKERNWCPDDRQSQKWRGWRDHRPSHQVKSLTVYKKGSHILKPGYFTLDSCAIRSGDTLGFNSGKLSLVKSHWRKVKSHSRDIKSPLKNMTPVTNEKSHVIRTCNMGFRTSNKKVLRNPQTMYILKIN